MTQTLTPLPGAYAVCRLAPDAPFPVAPDAGAGGLWSITRTPAELSVVCRAHEAPADATHVDRPWCALELQGPFDLTGETGVIASVARPIADARISVFAMATYDTDYVLVPAAQAARVRAALTAAGHEVAVPATTIRPVGPADVEPVGRLVGECFSAYAAFAPDGWEPGPAAVPQPELLGRDDVCWVVAADAAGVPRGAAAVRATEDPALGHVGQLFVDPGHQGTGLADELLDTITAAARADGRRALQLYCARDGEQARRFYARRGWVPDPADDGSTPGPGGLPVVRLRRDL